MHGEDAPPTSLTITNLQSHSRSPAYFHSLSPIYIPSRSPAYFQSTSPPEAPPTSTHYQPIYHPLQSPRLLPLTITNLHPLQKPRLLPLTITNLHPLQSLRSAGERRPRGTITERHKLTTPECFHSLFSGWWNELPTAILNAESLTIFKRNLKTHLFQHHLTSS